MLKYTMHCIYESTLVQRLSRGDLTLFSPASISSFYDIFNSYSLSQNGWDTLGSPCPLNVGVQDLVTELR